MICRDDKDTIIMLSGLISHIDTETTCSTNQKLKTQEQARNMLEDVMLRTKIKREDITKLAKDIDKGKYKLAVITADNYGRRINRRKNKVVEMTLYEMDTLKEEAMQSCKGCTRNRSACPLRKVLRKTNTEPYHDEKGKCEFKPD